MATNRCRAAGCLSALQEEAVVPFCRGCRKMIPTTILSALNTAKPPMQEEAIKDARSVLTWRASHEKLARVLAHGSSADRKRT